ncbi:tandem lipoprotein [Staphylococcus aureus subsp. aureus IS-55]|nr:tandem lipoprotein [Staphylococcus aureus subsp. aureus IS-55]
MKCFQKLYIFILILIVLMAGCESNKITGDSKETQIKKSFAKTLDMYPTENLEDFYDKEGYRDGEFEKDDKGTWLIRSEMKIQLKGENLESRGAVIEINRNTRTAKGNYIVREVVEDSDGMTHNHTKRYPVKMENNKMIPLKSIDDEKVKKKLKNLNSLYNTGISKNWKTIKRTKCHITQKYQYTLHNIN